ncbi:hypothetical protein BD410DRAFT_720197 [Rickenella mellea]|uniref:Protein kinase domain-containing protein n=1 Tax=Rickenella mellea TaxID=50990 RepID=A0A4Y7Q9D7_9AGAM|nr:hypothetical protein BD410DRAFT_720197 [Rickenella mellea]
MLQERGYRLRPRYRPGWKPSWTDTDIHPVYCEDSFTIIHWKILDATRISDGKTVIIKRVPVDSPEGDIAQFLSSPERLLDERNHTVPIFDRFRDDSVPDSEFIVMPLLRLATDPPFAVVSEIVELVRQTLEGLVYMHEQGVAHRDFSWLNIMLDASPMYPTGFHAQMKFLDPTGIHSVRETRRCDLNTVKYYIVDFGLSVRFEESDMVRLVTGVAAQDRNVPELSTSTPYDPFMVDIFTLGNFYLETLIASYSNLNFLTPLAIAMTKRDPKERPTAVEASNLFKDAVENLPGYKLRWRVRDPDDTVISSVISDAQSALREIMYQIKLFLGVSQSNSQLLHWSMSDYSVGNPGNHSSNPTDG